jgi:hypothetical protein
MERLAAHFTIQLAEPILVEDRLGAKQTFVVAHNAYEVEVAWDDEDVSSRIWEPGSRRPCYGISRLTITASHPETEAYPEDHNERVTYIQTRLKEYANVAAIVTNRLVRYFKFLLGNPFLQEIAPQQFINSNPTWMDENNNPLPRAIIYIEMQAVPGLRDYPSFGIKVFTPEQSDDLKKALQVDSKYELFEELMVDARSALVQRNFARAVLEMAIACEVATKQLFSKRGIKLKSHIPQAIHKRAVEVFGISFRRSNRKDWHNIKYLFECRNSIAHGESLGYKDKYQNRQNVDFKTLQDWWDSLDALLAWFRNR